MSAPSEIERRLQRTIELIADQEQAITSAPADEPNPLTISIKALEKLKNRLERQLEEAGQAEALEAYQ